MDGGGLCQCFLSLSPSGLGTLFQRRPEVLVGEFPMSKEVNLEGLGSCDPRCWGWEDGWLRPGVLRSKDTFFRFLEWDRGR